MGEADQGQGGEMLNVQVRQAARGMKYFREPKGLGYQPRRSVHESLSFAAQFAIALQELEEESICALR